MYRKLISGVAVFALMTSSGLASARESRAVSSDPSRQQSSRNVEGLKQAAQGRDVNAQYALAMAYLSGERIAVDPVLAAKWMRKAADGGHLRAEYQLGLMYRDGVGVTKDLLQARRWLALAAGWDLPDARIALDRIQREIAVSEVQSLRSAATRGDAQAQYKLGKFYLSGNAFTSVDSSQAFEWFRRAAEQAFADAEYELGVLYRDGRGVTRNSTTAKQWLEKAVEHGSVAAKVVMQDLVRAERGATPDLDKAFESSVSKPIYHAAAGGDRDAQFELGGIYLRGDVVPKDVVAGIGWLRKSADQDNVQAQVFLGDLYLRGVDVERDYSEAATWYTRAARAGNAEAQYMLASLYRMGLGVKENSREAKRWYAAAAKQGHGKARERLADNTR